MRYFIILALALLPSIAEAGTDGINSLLQVTEQRSDNANEAAMDGAEQSSGSAESQKQKRERLRQIEARPASPGPERRTLRG